MRRRELIAGLWGAAVAWPIAARAQQPVMPIVGFLNAGSTETSANVVAAFRKGLSEAGYVEGRNVAIEYRFGNNNSAQLPEMAADLVRRKVAVIATPSSVLAGLAAKAVTSTIPIVFTTGADPVQSGLVESLNRPGGNVTGVTTVGAELGAKRLGLLHALLPSATRFAMLANPIYPVNALLIGDLRTAASIISRQIEVVTAGTNRDIDAAFAIMVQQRLDALVVPPDQFFISRRVQFATLAVRHAVPVIYPVRDFVEVGGLMSYGSNIADQHRQVGLYVGRILKGEKPADLPVMQPTKFEFVINLTTARVLDINVPTTLLAQADEVIE